MEYLIYIITGMVAGTLAGMLGIGGGLIIVPILYFVLLGLGFDSSQLMQIALATSLATIISTAISSIIAHQKFNAIDWQKVKLLTPGILLGALLSGWLAGYLNSNYLKIFFSLFLFFVTWQMLKPQKGQNRRPLSQANHHTNTIKDYLAGIIIGAVSALVGIGGGTLTVPYLNFSGMQLNRAIATSAACGLPIAIGATLGYVLSGWQQFSGAFIGYVYLPAWFSIALVSLFFAPIGAKLTHQLPIATIKKIFALVLLLVAIKMLLSNF